MLIKPQALKSLNSIEEIQPRKMILFTNPSARAGYDTMSIFKRRKMIATFNGNPSATIISCYSPTNVSEETDLVAFYNELSSLVCSIPKHNVLVIGGDINAPISKNVNHKFILHNSSNRNGEYLTNFTLENRLTCLNTKFQKRKGKL